MNKNTMTSILILSVCVLSQMAMADNMRREINLKGNWKFQAGDDEEYAEKNYNDSNWRTIWVPKKWEDQGYHNMDGYGWYRTQVKIPVSLKNKSLFLKVGKIDDADRVYVNGKMIGSTGIMGDNHHTEHETQRVYVLDSDMIRFGKENVIAVQVWDRGGGGGIRDGQVGIYSRPQLDMISNLSGTWKFTTGDRSRYSERDYNDNNWDQKRVPSYWGDDEWSSRIQYGWYRKSFRLSNTGDKDQLLLILGRIDDSDRVYLNGTLIGITGNMPGSVGPYDDDAWDKDRVYYIPRHLLNKKGNNVLAIKVYNRMMQGGIYSGPIGIVNQKVYKNYLNQGD